MKRRRLNQSADVRWAQAIGHLQSPMADAQLEAIFHGLADPVIGAARSAYFVPAAGAVRDAPKVQALIALAHI